MELDLSEPKLLSIFGNTGAGKTYCVKHILKALKNQKIAIMDYHNEYGDLDRYPNIDRIVPKNTEKNNVVQLYIFFQKVLQYVRNKAEHNVLVIDEANQYVLKNQECYEMRDIKNNHRHFKKPLSVLFIMRRPTQFNTDVIEQSHYMIIFSIKGKNTIKYFNELSGGLGDAVAKLQTRQFVFVNENRDFEITKV